jgi:SSS family solute:Na+ symporter
VVRRRPSFNLEKMLHRGAYALPGTEKAKRRETRSRFHPSRILGFDSNFTFWDKLVAGGIFGWSLLLVAINLFVSFWNAAISEWPVKWWANYWLITGIGVPFAIAAITLAWFGIGGVIDMRDFFRALRNLKRDARDDGRVVGTHNLADEPTRGFPVVAPEAVAVARAEAQTSAASTDKTPAGVS